MNENQDYEEVGVYDAQDLQKKVNEQALQMEPIVRPLMLVAEKNGKVFVSAEIPGIDISERPCYYKGHGRLKGSFVRIGDSDERFIDNKRIEGNIGNMLEDAIQFVRKNMRTKTIINPETGKREDVTDYPITAVREAILNALVHRDYSIHTEGMPIQLRMFEDRMEIHNPGGIYGRIKVDQLGKVQPDTRNPVLAGALEVMGLTENRYSGIPTIRKVMTEYGLPEPVFEDKRGSFIVTFYKEIESTAVIADIKQVKKDLVTFCETPKSREEICEYLGLKSKSYVMKEYVQPLLDLELLKMTIPNKPKSSNQRYISVQK